MVETAMLPCNQHAASLPATSDDWSSRGPPRPRSSSKSRPISTCGPARWRPTAGCQSISYATCCVPYKEPCGGTYRLRRGKRTTRWRWKGSSRTKTATKTVMETATTGRFRRPRSRYSPYETFQKPDPGESRLQRLSSELIANIYIYISMPIVISVLSLTLEHPPHKHLHYCEEDMALFSGVVQGTRYVRVSEQRQWATAIALGDEDPVATLLLMLSNLQKSTSTPSRGRNWSSLLYRTMKRVLDNPRSPAPLGHLEAANISLKGSRRVRVQEDLEAFVQFSQLESVGELVGRDIHLND